MIRSCRLAALLISIAWPVMAHAAGDPVAAPPAGEIEAVVTRFCDAMTRMKGDEAIALFDRNETNILYLPEEQPDWLVGWDQLTYYLTEPKRYTMMQAMDMRPSNIRVRALTGDLALATWEVLAEMKFRFSKPLGEKIRANGIFRRTADGWKFIYYAEAPKSTLAYVNDMYENMASPDFRKRFPAPPGGPGMAR